MTNRWATAVANKTASVAGEHAGGTYCVEITPRVDTVLTRHHLCFSGVRRFTQRDLGRTNTVGKVLRTGPIWTVLFVDQANDHTKREK